MTQDSIRYNADDWEDIRKRFVNSSMMDAELSALGENAGIDWRGPGSDTTPDELVVLSYDELLMHPTINGNPNRLERLIDIFKETLAFDDPLGALIGAGDEEEDPAAEIMERAKKMGLNEEYPIELIPLSAPTRDFCEGEQISNLGQLLRMGSRLAGNIVIGGDFKDILNAVSSDNKPVLQRYLPIRAEINGFQLPEALGLLPSHTEEAVRLGLFRKFGGVLTSKESGQAGSVSEVRQDEALEKLETLTQQTLDYFTDHKDELDRAAREADALRQYLSVLKNEVKEKIAFALVWKHYQGQYPKSRVSFLGRLFGRSR